MTKNLLIAAPRKVLYVCMVRNKLRVSFNYTREEMKCVPFNAAFTWALLVTEQLVATTIL